ncbi:hypothetical protein KR044_008605 [Drosophila immigrans]|nr:hypothetical protein KR044_008605 [Drosophila immigrans]
MAMLAEPRRRKKYNLCPRGKALYEDSARFGTKMLEKMGWSKGQGLGANLDGSQDFVRVRFKNDAEGLGYENRDDQWTEHEEGFNGLLNSLNGGSADDASNTNENSGDASASEEEARPMGFGFKEVTEKKVKTKTLKDNISGISLEETSKFSKARVHYKKFTRGKDLSRYSEKDLANIFGKKAAEDIDVPVQPVVPEQQPAEEAEETTVDSNFAGVHTVSTGLSVNDYFRQKMEAMKNRLNNNTFVAAEESSSVEPSSEAQQEKKKKKAKRAKEDADEQEEVIIDISLVEEAAPKQKKKKKSKRVAEEEAEAESEVKTEEKKEKKSKRAVEEEAEAASEVKTEKKKEKKSKRAVEEEQKSELTDEKPPQKKKSKCAAEEGAEQEQPVIESTPTEESVPKEKEKKKKKNKSKKAAAEEATVEQQPEVEAVPSVEDAPKEKKKKSKRAAEADAVELEQPVMEAEETSQPKRKKKKKNKEEEIEEIKETPVEEVQCVEETNEQSKKKKKSKKHETIDVSADDSSSSDADNESDNNYLSYKQLIEKRDSFTVCTISSFCAEKFYAFDMKAYKNSTIAQIPGYDVDENIKLKVVNTKNDNLRIMSLWEGRTNKYTAKAKDKDKAHLRAVKRRKVFSVI